CRPSPRGHYRAVRLRDPRGTGWTRTRHGAQVRGIHRDELIVEPRNRLKPRGVRNEHVERKQRNNREVCSWFRGQVGQAGDARSEEHTSELQSRENLVCRLLLEKKKKKQIKQK